MMSKCEKETSGIRHCSVSLCLCGYQRETNHKDTKTQRRVFVSVCLLLLVLIPAGCRRDMQDQPRMKPFRESTFFRDGLSGRQPIEGTVPRGFLRSDTAYHTGKRTATPEAQQVTGTPNNAYPNAVETFPFPVTEAIIRRGRERYDIFCSVCHGRTGYGDGMIVRRGFRRAASFHDDRLRQAPVGHFFDAITNGWGSMPSYASQIPVQDRWAIIGYIRALQVSQQSTTEAPAAPAPAPTQRTGGQQ